MAFLTYAFPFSYIAWFAILVLGITTGFFIFSAFAIAVFVLLYALDMIRIMPLAEKLEKVLRYFYADTIGCVEENIKKSLTVSVPESVLGSSSRADQGPIIYVWIPHGLFATSLYYHSISTHTDMPAALKPISPVIHHWTRYIPFASEIFAHYNITYSTYNDMLGALKAGKSISVALGGVREMEETGETTIHTTIAKRKGIYRLAVETGAAIVPVISYGENSLFRPSTHWIAHGLNRLLRPLGLAAPIPSWESARNWLNIANQPLPHGSHSVFGDPISAEKHGVDELKTLVLESIRTLYSATRPPHYSESIEFLE
jgi:hypothetical protein